MKKLLAVLLSVLLVCLCMAPAYASGEDPARALSDSFGAYDHVFIIGVDGAGRFFNEVNTPEFDRIFADGAVDYTARAEMVTVSAQNWGSILSGVSYLRHGLTNDKADTNERDSSTKYPTVFTYARRAFPEATLASIVNWNPINSGIIETDIGVYKASYGDDESVTNAICDYFDAGNAPTLFFSHFDEVDHAGHEYGSKSQEYISAIEAADARVGRIYDAVERNGLMENGLFIVVADHGHMVVGGHFGLTARETDTTLAVKGKTVVSGGGMDNDTRNRDVSAIVLYALGIERPAYMSSRVPANLFENTEGEKRDIRSDMFDAILCKLAWVITVLTKWI
jgi:hypothetical protein